MRCFIEPRFLYLETGHILSKRMHVQWHWSVYTDLVNGPIIITEHLPFGKALGAC